MKLKKLNKRAIALIVYVCAYGLSPIGIQVAFAEEGSEKPPSAKNGDLKPLAVKAQLPGKTGKDAASVRPGASASQKNVVDAASGKADTKPVSANSDGKTAPTNNEAYGKGCKFLKDNDAHSAIAQFNKVIKTEPKNAMAFCKRAEAYSFIENDKLAMKDYNMAINLDSKNAEAYYNRGHLKSGKDDTNGAIADYTLAIQNDPKMVEAYGDRGMLKKEKGQKEAAIADFSKVVEIDRKLRWPLVQRGLVYIDVKQFDKAVSDFDAIVALDPKNFDGYELRGKAYQAAGKYDKARDDFSEVIKLSPDYAGGFTYRAQAYEKLEGANSKNAKADHAWLKKHGY